MYLSMKAQTISSGSLSILGHLLPTASSGHEVILSSGTQFLSHNLCNVFHTHIHILVHDT